MALQTNPKLFVPCFLCITAELGLYALLSHFLGTVPALGIFIVLLAVLCCLSPRTEKQKSILGMAVIVAILTILLFGVQQINNGILQSQPFLLKLCVTAVLLGLLVFITVIGDKIRRRRGL